MTKIVLWVSDLEAQSSFYSALLEASVGESSAGFRQIVSTANEVLLHQLPEQYRLQLPLSQAALAQEEVAIKPVFQVSSIESARQRVTASYAQFAQHSNVYGEFTYQDLVDPEGNVIQLEQRT